MLYCRASSNDSEDQCNVRLMYFSQIAACHSGSLLMIGAVIVLMFMHKCPHLKEMLVRGNPQYIFIADIAVATSLIKSPLYDSKVLISAEQPAQPPGLCRPSSWGRKRTCGMDTGCNILADTPLGAYLPESQFKTALMRPVADWKNRASAYTVETVVWSHCFQASAFSYRLE